MNIIINFVYKSDRATKISVERILRILHGRDEQELRRNGKVTGQ